LTIFAAAIITMIVNLRSFRLKLRHHRARFKKFLSKLEKKQPHRLFSTLVKIEKEVWKETDCLTCANCCKTMTPTYTVKDVKRIARHFSMSPTAFRKKWLKKDKEGDWMNKHLPCQFLDEQTNKCTIYSIRPDDCKGFPHLTKRKVSDYIHVHKQNIEFCPATYKMVEKLMERLDDRC
jgi:Fe-S-cluster containining protein